MLTKLVSPQAAQLDFDIYRKNSNAAPPQGTPTRDPFEDPLLRKEREKSQAPDRNRTRNIYVTRRSLYHCATIAAHL